MYWELLHIDLTTTFLQEEPYDLEPRVIHVRLPFDIGLPPYLVGLCTRSVYGLADAPRRWWNRLGKFLISLGIQPTRNTGLMYVVMELSKMMTCPQVRRQPRKSRTRWTRHQAR